MASCCLTSPSVVVDSVDDGLFMLNVSNNYLEMESSHTPCACVCMSECVCVCFPVAVSCCDANVVTLGGSVVCEVCALRSWMRLILCLPWLDV